ncbi:hypothetical protein ACXIVK_18925 [Paraburkholderia caledonica]
MNRRPVFLSLIDLNNAYRLLVFVVGAVGMTGVATCFAAAFDIRPVPFPVAKSRAQHRLVATVKDLNRKIMAVRASVVATIGRELQFRSTQHQFSRSRSRSASIVVDLIRRMTLDRLCSTL